MTLADPLDASATAARAQSQDIPALMTDIGRRARAAAATLAQASTQAKDTALRGAAEAMRANASAILDANALKPVGVQQQPIDQRRPQSLGPGSVQIAGVADRSVVVGHRPA